LDRYIYELPAGTLNEGEAPAACAERELEEETGYRAGALERLGCIYPAPGYTTEKLVIFRAVKLIECGRRPEEDEFMTVERLSRRQLADYVASGIIVDAKTICGLKLAGVI
jgi:ADP-ribose pyrophosphatase